MHEGVGSAIRHRTAASACRTNSRRVCFCFTASAHPLIAGPELKLAEIADPHLFVHKTAPPPASSAAAPAPMEPIKTAQSITPARRRMPSYPMHRPGRSKARGRSSRRNTWWRPPRRRPTVPAARRAVSPTLKKLWNSNRRTAGKCGGLEPQRPCRRRARRRRRAAADGKRSSKQTGDDRFAKHAFTRYGRTGPHRSGSRRNHGHRSAEARSQD